MFSFPKVHPDLGDWYNIWNVNTRDRGFEFEKNYLHTMALGVGISCKARPHFIYLLVAGGILGLFGQQYTDFGHI